MQVISGIPLLAADQRQQIGHAACQPVLSHEIADGQFCIILAGRQAEPRSCFQ